MLLEGCFHSRAEWSRPGKLFSQISGRNIGEQGASAQEVTQCAREWREEMETISQDVASQAQAEGLGRATGTRGHHPCQGSILGFFSWWLTRSRVSRWGLLLGHFLCSPNPTEPFFLFFISITLSTKWNGIAYHPLALSLLLFFSPKFHLKVDHKNAVWFRLLTAHSLSSISHLFLAYCSPYILLYYRPYHVGFWFYIEYTSWLFSLTMSSLRA